MGLPGDQSIRELLHRLLLVEGALDQQIERVSWVAYQLKTLLGKGIVGRDNLPSSGMSQVARSLRIEEHHDGSVVFAIDSSQKFSLAPRLADLLQFLASADVDKGDGRGALIGFRSRREILVHLEKTAGRTFRAQYVNNLVNLLKKSLRKYDQRSLILTSRPKGVRFLLTRGGD